MNNFGISSGSTKDDGDDEQTRLPGFRFHPTDQELVGFYLRRKVEKKPMIMELIRQIDIYKYDPWDLPKGSTVGENEWYFFCKRGRKYKNSVRPNRVTKSGFWKATGIDKPLYSSSNHNHNHINGSSCIGLKKSLVYYIGAAGKGSKTDWMMHEFRLPPIDHPEQSTNMQISNSKLLSPHLLPEAEVWTLCRIFKRNMSYKKYNNNNGTIYGYTPLVSKKQVPTHKQIPREACSATCSIESDDRSDYNGYISFETPLNTFQNNHHHQKKEMDDGRSQQLVLSQFNPNMSITSTASLGLSEAGSGLSINQGFFTNEDWDELRSVVDQSLLPNSPFQ